MTTNRRTVPAVTLAWVVGSLIPSPTRASKPAPGAPPLAIRAQADLRLVVEALCRATGGVVVADAREGEERRTKAALDLPLEEALNRVSIDFDRYWIRCGNSVVLQDRFASPAGAPEVEIEELRATVDDLYTLLSFAAPGFGSGEYTERKAAFAGSMTPQQLELLVGPGLPFSLLSRDQQQSWLAINAYQAYGPTFSRLDATRRTLARWPEVVMERPAAPNARSTPDLFLRRPEPGRPEGAVVASLPIVSANPRPRPARAEGRIIPAPSSSPPGDLKPSWSIPCRGIELGSLPKLLEAAGGPALSVPAYANERRLWIASGRASRAEVLRAVADLWGWEYRRAGRGYQLGRRKLRRALDPVALHEQARAAIPPAIRHSLQARKEGATDRLGEQVNLVLTAAARRAEADWKRLRVGELPELEQSRLANLLVLDRLDGGYGAAAALSEQPRAWLSRPQSGIFRLSGPPGPDRHPTLMFMVEDRQETRQTAVGWGWALGTARSIPGR